MPTPATHRPHDVEHLDVLVLGAGISGLGAAYYLQTERPGTTFAVLEARDSLGGTWDLFSYPGIRSDSDLYTFGYDFAPWRENSSIAPADKILNYLHETVDEHHLERHIRYGYKVTAASWSSDDARWTVTTEHDGGTATFTCGWIFSATGYYDYDRGYTPDFPGLDRFAGEVVHPQHWRDDLDYAGKRVVIIGSGATAVTLAPAMAPAAEHVTILQRTPTYILSVPSVDALAVRLQKLLGEERAHPLVRLKSIAQQRALYLFCQRFPKQARALIRKLTVKQLPEGYPVDKHFHPPYDPWDQRLCVVPDGDLFRSIRKGEVSMATDRIRTFTETGIELESGETLDADVVVTATGLNLLPFGGVDLSVDDRKVELNQTVAYKGMMLSGIPNYAYAIGYTNASWTLKVGLLCEQFCRLLAYMDENDYQSCTPEIDTSTVETRPLLDFGAGYVQRSIGQLPRQATQSPWRTTMSYFDDVRSLRKAPVADEHLHFERVPASSTADVA